MTLRARRLLVVALAIAAIAPLGARCNKAPPDIRIDSPANGIFTEAGSIQVSGKVTGVSVDRHKVYAYTLMGAMAALAGLMLMGKLNAIQATSAPYFNLHVIAAVVVGGLFTLLASTLLLLPTLYALFNPTAETTSEIEEAVEATTTPRPAPTPS